jgi:DNA-binding NtrC family response regulator
LIESELFGHSRGAFTGALKDRLGRAEVADGGTLFLDEICDLPLELQAKLHTFLQDRLVQRIGSSESKRVDVRLIVATHRDLSERCKVNRFRQDLYYRLNVLNLNLPPLRERIDEIGTITNSILTRICHQQKISTLRINEKALEAIRAYRWPGNIRELENVLERAVAFCESGSISPSDLLFDKSIEIDSGSQQAMGSVELAGKTLEEIERLAIQATLLVCSGNKAKTARMLGISEKSIYNKIRRLDITEHMPSAAVTR